MLSERQQESLTIIQEQATWVQVIMPLVKRSKEGGWPEVGFMLPEGVAKVYKTNMWALEPGIPLGEQLKDVPVAEYPSYEALVQDGWEVD